MKYKCGDVVKVWSLQSFFNGGFLNGEIAIVRQNQHSNSPAVMLIVKRNIKGKYMLDLSYEVYEKQTELVSRSKDDGKSVGKMLEILNTIRIHTPKSYDNSDLYNYTSDFFINDMYELELDVEKILHPEYII